MRTWEKTAVVACAQAETAAALEAMLQERGFRLRARLIQGTDVVRTVEDLRPDVGALDAILPGVDGISCAERLLAARLSVVPAILVLQAAHFLPGRADALRASGCAFLQRPLSGEALDRALAETELTARRVSPSISKALERLFDQLGLPERNGRKYLHTAILFVYQDIRLIHRLTGGLYPLVARVHGTDPRTVERSMRRAIEHAWKYGKIDEQYAIFGGTIDAQRGKPTCGEMIAHLADILRLEG